MTQITENRAYVPKTPFGKAVAETGFGRVCPRCRAQWSDPKLFKRDCDARGRQFVGNVRQVIWSHRNCGGQMLTDGSSGLGGHGLVAGMDEADAS